MKKRDKKLRKKRGVFIIVFIVFISSFFGSYTIDGYIINTPYVLAESDKESVEEELEIETEKQLDDLDFSDLEIYIDNLESSVKDMFSGSFVGKVESLINGEYITGDSFLSSVFSLLWDGLLDFLPIIASIIAVSILGGMVGNLKPNTGGKSIGNIIHFVTYGIVIVFLGTTLVELIALTSKTLTSLKSLMDMIFPVLLTLLTAVGGSVSVGLYQPAIALLGNIFISLITYFLMPLFIFSIVFSIVGNLSNNVKLDKFVAFLQGTFKWSIGLLFTLFLGFITIQGISASAVDGLSIRTAKYTIKSYVPIVGGYVSDGLSIIMASSMLIKNAVGTAGLLLILFSVISPVISLILFMLSLRFMAGIIEPVGDRKTANFVSDISKSMSMLIALIVAVSFMYMVMTGLIMCSCNLI